MNKYFLRTSRSTALDKYGWTPSRQALIKRPKQVPYAYRQVKGKYFHQRNSQSPVANVTTGDDGLVDKICLPIASHVEYRPGPGPGVADETPPPAGIPATSAPPLPPEQPPLPPPRDPGRPPISTPHRGPGCVLVAERFGRKLPGPGAGRFSA